MCFKFTSTIITHIGSLLHSMTVHAHTYMCNVYNATYMYIVTRVSYRIFLVGAAKFVGHYHSIMHEFAAGDSCNMM